MISLFEKMSIKRASKKAEERFMLTNPIYRIGESRSYVMTAKLPKMMIPIVQPINRFEFIISLLNVPVVIYRSILIIGLTRASVAGRLMCKAFRVTSIVHRNPTAKIHRSVAQSTARDVRRLSVSYELRTTLSEADYE